MRRRFFTFGGAMPTFFLGSAPHPVNFLFLRGAAPNPVRFLKRKRSKELDTFNKADFLCLCKGHKINKEHKVSL